MKLIFFGVWPALAVIGLISVTKVEAGDTQIFQPSTHQIVQNLQELCPENAGGQPLVARYTTETFYIYICQGGKSRGDWRELEYYGIPQNRRQAEQWIRLRAYIGNAGYYAINGTTRYEINRSFLKITEQGKIILREAVLNCEGNPSACQ